MESPDTEVQTQAAEVLNRSNLERSNNSRYTSPRGTENKENRQNNSTHNPPEVYVLTLAMFVIIYFLCLCKTLA